MKVLALVAQLDYSLNNILRYIMLTRFFCVVFVFAVILFRSPPFIHTKHKGC